MLLLSEKEKILDFIRKEKNCVLRLLSSTVRTNHEEGKRNSYCFAVAPQTAKVTAAVP